MEFRLPDYSTVVEVHDIILDTYPGLAGMPHPEYIEASLARPMHHMAYRDDCDLDMVAAILLDSLARNHAFADANKRTALLTTILTYRLNGLSLDITMFKNIELEKLVVDIADDKDKKISLEQIRDRHKRILQNL